MAQSPKKTERKKNCFIFRMSNSTLVSDVLLHSIISKRCLWHCMAWSLGHSITTKYEKINLIMFKTIVLLHVVSISPKVVS